MLGLKVCQLGKAAKKTQRAISSQNRKEVLCVQEKDGLCKNWCNQQLLHYANGVLPNCWCDHC
jgi:hypothetical protein